MTYLDKFKLAGKTIVVSGGSGLIGKEICRALKETGAKVINLDLHNNTEVFFEKFDMVVDDVQKVWDKYGPIHGWVNAAYPRTDDWKEGRLSSFSRNLEMQLSAMCKLTLSVSELMKQEKGSIVNLGSIYGVVAPDFDIYEETAVLPPPAAYAAIKGGLLNFTRYAAAKYGRHGIRVNCVCPGGVFDSQDAKFVENYSRRTALRRMGAPEEVASAVLFLLSEASSYITGTAFMVDGGWTSI